MTGKRLKSTPPAPRTDEEKRHYKASFIAGEDTTGLHRIMSELEASGTLPWNAPHIRPDVKKLFSLRLPEPEMLKLQFIHKKTGKSMHQFCMDAVLPAIEQEIRRLLTESS
jgi:hypothetical protein